MHVATAASPTATRPPCRKAHTMRPLRITVRPVVLIDVFSVFFRAHHALPPMNTSGGEPTSAMYGFSSLLLEIAARAIAARVGVCARRAAADVSSRFLCALQSGSPAHPRCRDPAARPLVRALARPRRTGVRGPRFRSRRCARHAGQPPARAVARRARGERRSRHAATRPPRREHSISGRARQRAHAIR